MSFSDAAEILALNFLFNTQAATRPTTWFVSLHSADPGESAGSNELTGAGYARKSVTFGAAAAGAVKNTSAPSWTSTETVSNWPTASHFGVWTAATGGTFLGSGALSTARTLGPGDSATFAANAITISLD